MIRYLVLLMGISSLLLAMALVAWSADGEAEAGPVYTVAAVQAGLAHDRAAWLQRVVVIRAHIEPCPWWGIAARRRHCAGQPLVLIGTGTATPAAPLPLIRPALAPLGVVLRRLPWLGDRLPRPASVDPFVPARYRVRLLALPAGAGASCYAALLLATAPLVRQEV